MIQWYVLKGKEIVPATATEANSFLGSDDKIIRQDELPDGVKVSTVFLCLDYSRIGVNEGSPIVFETMIFGGSEDGYQERCATWDEAMAEHWKACKIADPFVGAVLEANYKSEHTQDGKV